jgi:tripartite-type tricarboxylate transporter receptor subunit TctC
VSAALYSKLRFDPVESFAFVSLVGTFPFVVATRPDSPIKTLSDLVETAQKQPGRLSFSSVGFGSTQHLTGELLALAANGKLTHVPYRGGMQPLTDVLGGQIDLIVDTITVTGPAIKAGTLRGLGVSSAAPWPALPDVPPIAARLPGFEVKSWIGIAAPAGTPPAILARLNEVLAKAVADPAFAARLDLLGIRAESSTPDGMKAFVAAEIGRWNDVVEKAGLEKLK